MIARSWFLILEASMVRWDAVATGGACLSASLGFALCVYIGALLWSNLNAGLFECEVISPDDTHVPASHDSITSLHGHYHTEI